MSVTEQDRERAREVILSGDAGPESWTQILAQALADERERAESDAYDRGAADALHGVTAELMPHETLTVAYLRAEADRIRTAAQESQ